MASSNALADCSPKLKDTQADLLPNLDCLQSISKQIALKVALAAIEDGVAPKVSVEELQLAIERNFWTPQYRNYQRITF